MGYSPVINSPATITPAGAASPDSCQLRHVLPSSPDAQVQVSKARSAAWSALSVRYTAAGARAWASLPPDRVGIILAGNTEASLWVNGVQIPPGGVMMLGEGSPVFVRAESAMELRACLLSRAHLPEAWRRALSTSPWDADAFLVGNPSPDESEPLSRAIGRLLAAGTDGPASAPQDSDAELLREALRALPGPQSLSLRRRHPGKAARQDQLCRYLRSDAFQLAEWGKAVPDLMRLLAIGRRTLEYEVQELSGMSPYAWLTTMRLDRVRKDLTREGSRARVGEVAARWGFLHHGRFARAYLNRFGELPRQTATRSLHNSSRAAA